MVPLGALLLHKNIFAPGYVLSRLCKVVLNDLYAPLTCPFNSLNIVRMNLDLLQARKVFGHELMP